MRAVVVRAPNDFGLEDVPEPNPGDYEALVRIITSRACSPCPQSSATSPSAE